MMTSLRRKGHVIPMNWSENCSAICPAWIFLLQPLKEPGYWWILNSTQVKNLYLQVKQMYSSCCAWYSPKRCPEQMPDWSLRFHLRTPFYIPIWFIVTWMIKCQWISLRYYVLMHLLQEQISICTIWSSSVGFYQFACYPDNTIIRTTIMTTIFPHIILIHSHTFL